MNRGQSMTPRIKSCISLDYLVLYGQKYCLQGFEILCGGFEFCTQFTRYGAVLQGVNNGCLMDEASQHPLLILEI